jgi:cation diffusion facilitator family transporter
MDAAHPDRVKQRVALFSLLAAIGIFVFKLLVGLHTRSLGILAEAAHSALDLLATLLTFVSLRIAARPADANHPFGHGKFENFSAFLQTGLLVITSLAIAALATSRWLAGVEVQVHVDFWAFGVMLTSIVVDWSRSGILRRTAAAYKSDALAADALNFTSDMASSLAVLVGLGLVGIGQRWDIPPLRHADAAAACAVALALLWLALLLGRRTAGALLDEAPPELSRELAADLEDLEGLAGVERLRLRRVGSRYFVDLQLLLHPGTTFERVNSLRQEAVARVHRRLPDADVVVETQTRRVEPLGPFEQVQAIAQRQNVNLHDLAIYKNDHQLDIEFHLELPPLLPLAEAHDRVSRLEAEMRLGIPAVSSITTHIEPESNRIRDANLLDVRRISARVEQIAAQIPELLDCHDLQLRRSAGHLVLSCHCTLPDSLPVARVHDRVTELEAALKRGLPELFRITIHPEPGSDNRR